MIEDINKRINEFDDPFRGVNFPFDPDYQVDLKDCENPIEEFRETIASKVAQKYNLIYHQGDAICTKTNEQLEDLKKAKKEIGKYMKVNIIRWSGGVDKRYFFVFNSWEMPV